MTMTDNVPDWMTPVAWIFLAAAVISAALIAYDIYGRGHRRESVPAEVVWVTSALYLGPLAVTLHARHRASVLTSTTDAGHVPDAPTSSRVVIGLPGGGASAVAHLIGVPLVLASGLTIAGIDLWVMILVIGALAMLLLFVFERTAFGNTAPPAFENTAPPAFENTAPPAFDNTAPPAFKNTAPPARDRRVSVRAAAGAAVLTVLAFDVGMGGWMLLLHFNEFMPPASEGTFWFLMQLGIVLGLATGYPVVSWLARRSRTLTPA